MKFKLAIIDTDGMFFHSARDTMEESIESFKEKFNNLLEKTQCTHYIGFYSNGRYFRHWIDPEYKGQRVGKTYPKFLKALKQWAISEYGFQQMDSVEADDLCAYWINKRSFEISSAPELWGLDTFDLVLCSPDKDLLESIPGKHFNYSYKLTEEAKNLKKMNAEYSIPDKDIIKGWWVETDIAAVNKFRALQMLTGDASDNIKGLEGIGPKKAEMILAAYKVGTDLMTFIFDAYRRFYKDDYGKAIFEFQKNYRLLHLLETEQDFIREIGEKPIDPVIITVKQEKPKIEF